jgi:hypothetical protein
MEKKSIEWAIELFENLLVDSMKRVNESHPIDSLDPNGGKLIN